MERAFKYRFYPTPEQESLLRRALAPLFSLTVGSLVLKPVPSVDIKSIRFR